MLVTRGADPKMLLSRGPDGAIIAHPPRLPRPDKVISLTRSFTEFTRSKFLLAFRA